MRVLNIFWNKYEVYDVVTYKLIKVVFLSIVSKADIFFKF